VFDRSAHLYDAFYDALGKDYAWEAARVLKLARRRLQPRRPQSLLDVACGTGRHLEVFSRTLRCAGVDLDAKLLAIAAQRCPSVPMIEADMVSFSLGERFDIVTCLFSAIAYVGTVPRLRRAVRTMAGHLAPGGVLIVEPWFQPEDWRVGEVQALFVDTDGLKAARVSRSGRRRDLSVLEFHYLVGDAGGVEHFTENHELRLFRWSDYTDAFRRAGLDVDTEEKGLFGRGLLIGTAPA